MAARLKPSAWEPAEGESCSCPTRLTILRSLLFAVSINSPKSAPVRPAVFVNDVCKHYGQVQVLRDVCLEVKQGSVVCIIGPSGAGKSTLLRCMNHLERPDAGAHGTGPGRRGQRSRRE